MNNEHLLNTDNLTKCRQNLEVVLLVRHQCRVLYFSLEAIFQPISYNRCWSCKTERFDSLTLRADRLFSFQHVYVLLKELMWEMYIGLRFILPFIKALVEYEITSMSTIRSNDITRLPSCSHDITRSVFIEPRDAIWLNVCLANLHHIRFIYTAKKCGENRDFFLENHIICEIYFKWYFLFKSADGNISLTGM